MKLPCRRSMARWVAMASLAAIASACGGPSESRVPVYPTSGKVTFEGKPLPGALVIFRKAEGDPKVPSPTATTLEDGTFTLHTYEPDDGAPAGDYLIAVSTVARKSPDSGGGFLSRDPADKSKSARPVDVLQGRYADPKTSGLKATIMPPDNTLESIDLTATGGAVNQAPASGRDR